MKPEADLHEVIARIYDAALDRRLWAPALESVGDLLGGAAFIMSALDRYQGPQLTIATRVDPAAFALVIERFGTPTTNQLVAAMPNLPVCVPVARQLIEPDRAYLRSDLYNEAFRAQGLAHQAVACMLRTETLVAPLGVLRATDQGALSPVEMQTLQQLLPHLQRALNISLRLGSIETRLQLSLAGFDQLAFGVLLLDARGGAMHVNRAAEDFLARGDGLCLTRGVVGAQHRHDAAALRKTIAAVLAEPHRGAAVLQVRRAGERRPYVVIVLPLRRGNAEDSIPTDRGAMLLVGDPEQQSPGLGGYLRSLFGLSAVEAQLALALFEGQRLRDIASERGVSINTVKTELARIFAKTGTTGQADLARLLRGGPSTTQAQGAEG